MRNIVKYGDEIKAALVSKNGKLLASMRDNGFLSAGQICITVCALTNGRYDLRGAEVQIHNLTRDWIGYYTVGGRKKY